MTHLEQSSKLLLAMIRITSRIVIDERDIEETFVRASGPGGQNVNKLSSAVHLRFDVHGPSALPEDVRKRIKNIAGRRMTRNGVLVITAHRYRTQEQNRRDARARLIALIRQAACPVPRRLPTQPTGDSRKRRLEAKTLRSKLKASRRPKVMEE
jgi:ribosome-associated protein